MQGSALERRLRRISQQEAVRSGTARGRVDEIPTVRLRGNSTLHLQSGTIFVQRWGGRDDRSVCTEQGAALGGSPPPSLRVAASRPRAATARAEWLAVTGGRRCSRRRRRRLAVGDPCRGNDESRHRPFCHGVTDSIDHSTRGSRPSSVVTGATSTDGTGARRWSGLPLPLIRQWQQQRRRRRRREASTTVGNHRITLRGWS